MTESCPHCDSPILQAVVTGPTVAEVVPCGCLLPPQQVTGGEH
ncbi:hypothetical protein [Halomicrococcus sp. SG-WS-1]